MVEMLMLCLSQLGGHRDITEMVMDAWSMVLILVRMITVLMVIMGLMLMRVVMIEL